MFEMECWRARCSAPPAGMRDPTAAARPHSPPAPHAAAAAGRCRTDLQQALQFIRPPEDLRMFGLLEEAL
jgi:hypothetical protein